MGRVGKNSWLVVAMLALVWAAPAGAAEVTEFPLESNSIESLAQTPDGTIVYSASRPRGTIYSYEPWLGFVGRLGPNGPLGETPVPPSFPGNVAVGSEGTAWFGNSTEPIARLTAAGWSPTSARNPGSEQHVVAAAGGGVWFTSRSDSRGDVVGRISASGQVEEWAIPTHESGPRSIVEGSGGSAWFTEYFADKIGRVTPSGQITEYPLPAGTRPSALTVDAAGNVWFTGQSSIGRMSPEGTITMFPLGGVSPGAIAAGPDGRIWFTETTRRDTKPEYETVSRGLGRFNPNTDRYSEVRPPDADSDPIDLIAGSEGDLWYAAMGEGPCEGGGSTCMLWQPKNPAIVGRVAVAPLTTTVTAGAASVWRNRANVPIACSEGNAAESCRGTVEVKVGGRVVGRDRYVVPVDYTRQWPAKRLGHIPSLLKLVGKRRRGLAIIRPDAGGRLRRSISLTPAP